MRSITVLFIAIVLQSEAFALNILKSIEVTEEDGQVVPVYTFLEPVNPLSVETQMGAAGVDVKFADVQMITDKNSLPIDRNGVKAVDSITESEGDIKSHISFLNSGTGNSQYEKARVVADGNNIKIYLDRGAMPLAAEVSVTKPQVKKTSAEPTPSKKNNTMAESEIPLFVKSSLESTKPTKSPYIKLLFSFLLIGVMAGGLIFFSKWYAKNNKKAVDDTKIRVLTQHSLGPRKQLMIVRVAGESVLIGVTDTNITMLKSLSLLDEDIPNHTPTEFTESMSEAKKIENYSPHIKLKSPKESAKLKASADVDEFVIGNIKDKISSTLKGMRDI